MAEVEDDRVYGGGEMREVRGEEREGYAYSYIYLTFLKYMKVPFAAVVLTRMCACFVEFCNGLL